MKVSCLMATYGRHARVCEALGMFLAQDYPDRELVILNAHPVPMVFDHPLVRIVNDPIPATLGACRTRLLDFADGRFLRTWDDDDLYLPWCISQGIEHVGNADAWKPTRSWFTNGGETFELAGNAMEASVTWDRSAVERCGYSPTMGDEHGPLLSGLKIVEEEVGVWTGYCYRWGCGEFHASGSLGCGTVVARTAAWKARNQDARPHTPLVPVDMSPWWRRIAAFVPAPDRAAWAARAGIS